MKAQYYWISFFLLLFIFNINLRAQSMELSSPAGGIRIMILNEARLQYSVQFNGRELVMPSNLGFRFLNEPEMSGNFEVISSYTRSVNESWEPVVKSKHALVLNHFNELELTLREKSGLRRQMALTFRAFDDGVAFRYKLFRGERVGSRNILAELTGFTIPGDPKAWVVEYGGYASSNESEFFEHPLSYVSEKTIAGMPFLMDYGNNCWVAVTEADIENYPAFYIGTNGLTNNLVTKLVPLSGQPEDGIKARFEDEIHTPWRVLLIGSEPGVLIESEIIQNLNEPCAIGDPSFVIPGMSAWDHWWSGEVKMEMPVIKEYIDLAATMGWKYMLVDWQWYGPFNTPEADITRWAPQISMPEIIQYAAERNVKILVWLYSSDVNRNSAYKKAFPLYHEWGIAGVKIDFMDRDDQEMVNWYHDIIRCAAENRLMVDFHGAYKPDGIIRTYPNMITREGVMGNEYYKFSDKMNPEHNVKLAFTRMLAGQMDYTPGAFLNVTRENFKNQTPAIVWNTRAAELAKFVVYESPLTVVCDHPDHILGKPGADFLRIVPTVWDDTEFLGGYPGDYVAMARKNGENWYVGVLNNSKRKTIEINTGFLEEGTFEVEIYSDTKQSDTNPETISITKSSLRKGDPLKTSMAACGGFVAVFRPKK